MICGWQEIKTGNYGFGLSNHIKMKMQVNGHWVLLINAVRISMMFCIVK